MLGTADSEARDVATAPRHVRAVVSDAVDGSRSVWAAAGRVALAQVDMLENGESEATQMWREVARDAPRSVWAEREARFSALRDRESIRDLTDQADRYVRVTLEDPLIGLGNRRMLSGIVDRPDRPESVIFVDIDEFTSANDRYSHAVGDAVLENPWSEVAAGLSVTVSIGVAHAGEHHLVASADRALLVAKRLGRHRVVEAQ